MMNIKSMFDGKMNGERYDQMLESMGLQRKSSSSDALSNMGMFGLGIAVGVTLGMLFAPKTGQELRSQAKHKIPGIGRESMGSKQEQIHEQRV